VTGVTDATPHNGPAELAVFRDAAARGALLQRVRVMGEKALAAGGDEWVEVGEYKIMLDERDLPPLDGLVARIRAAHANGRCVAIHCVGRAELVLACGAIEEAGPRRGDRVEHAAIAPPPLADRLAALRVTVVTQPSFVRERGDQYLVRVEPRDRAWLYRCRGLLDAGVEVGGGTDAPFGDADPWAAMKAAVERRTLAGEVLGADERIAPERALSLFTSNAEAPGRARRTLAAGAVADLCLLDRPWTRAREVLASAMVRATWRAGRVVWRAA
jgi:predicted amidohydrolase YtcJ